MVVRRNSPTSQNLSQPALGVTVLAPVFRPAKVRDERGRTERRVSLLLWFWPS